MQGNTAYSQTYIQKTVPFSGDSIIVWGCVSYNCRLDLITVQETFTGHKNQTCILENTIIPHFDAITF